MSRLYYVSIFYTAAIILQSSECVNLNRYNKLSREDLLKLDQEVSDFYYNSYETLDRRKINYDDQLFNSIRSIRHTNVLNQFDYRYTDEELMERSSGSKVDSVICEQQLAVLAGFAVSYKDELTCESVPLSAINFLESSSRSEAGTLNGNFNWLGSFSSCEHATIPADLYPDQGSTFGRSNNKTSIDGRYCVAHLRAKSWPKDDLYFEDRISIKVGICIPDSCHTISYIRSPKIRELIETLTKSNMMAPFSGPRYEINYLFCFPDYDSPHRQLDLATKLFVLAVLVWSITLIYTNIKYQKRVKAMKQLRDSIDIRMVIIKQSGDGNQTGSAQSSLDARSELSELDETNERGNLKDKSSKWSISADEFVPNIDLIKAFAIKANIDFLFDRRSIERDLGTRSRISTSAQHEPTTSTKNNSRTSVSNQALLRDLEKENGSKGSRMSCLCKGTNQSSSSSSSNEPNKRKRVDIDVLDGIKVFATSYIVYGHTLMFFFGFVADLRFGNERMLDFVMIATINALQVVGLFYIITGILITYLAFSRQKTRQLLKPSLWIMVIVGRYLRLLPAYLLVFWFARHVSPHTGQGPTWLDHRTDDQNPRGYCAGESWLTMFTMSSADIKIPFDCVPQTWYLSNDFRTLMIIPFYIIILASFTLTYLVFVDRNRKAGYCAIFSTLIYSTYRLTNVLREADIDYMILLHWQPHVYSLMADRLHDVYTNLSTRLSTYLLGVIVGHLLYLYEIGEIKRMPWWFRRFALKVASLVGAISFMGAPLLASSSINQYLPSPDELDSDTVVILIPLIKSTMEICMCITLLSMATGGGYRWLNELLSSRVAKVLSNISYGVFLVHIEVMYKVPSGKFHSSYWYLFLYSCFFIVLSNMVAFLIHVLYEMPVNNVIRSLFKRIFNKIVE